MKVWKWLRAPKRPKSPLDAWAVIGLGAMYGGIFMGAGGMLMIFGTEMFGLQGEPLRDRLVPIFAGLFFVAGGILLLWNSYKSALAKGYLDVILHQGRKLAKQNRREK
jgi:hypothetical protein